MSWTKYMNWRMVKLSVKRICSFTALMIWIACVFSACALIPKQEEGLAPPLVEPSKPEVITAQVRQGTITKSFSASGSLQSISQTSHSFPSEGSIKEIYVKKGQQVKSGDVLIEQDIEGLELQLLQRQLAYEQAKLALDQAEANRSSETLLKIRRLELKIAEHHYQEVLATREQSTLEASVDGIITYVVNPNEPGYRFRKGQVLATISSSDELEIVTSSGGVHANDLMVGMEAEIVYNGKSYTGSVVQTPKSAGTDADGKDRLYFTFKDQPAEASMGESVKVTVVLAHQENTLVIPANGLRTFKDRQYVLVKNGNTRREVDVKTGIKTSSEVEILSGLSAGDTIILN